MSKAFTRESDDEPDQPVVRRLPSALPPGAKNYLTPGGASSLRAELNALLENRRALADSSNPGAATTRAGASAEQRIFQLQESLESAVIVEPPAPPWTQVRFGATVDVQERGGPVSSYRIVGVDEADFERGWISWLSPLARALMNARVGSRVRCQAPSGDRELEILRVRYE